MEGSPFLLCSFHLWHFKAWSWDLWPRNLAQEGTRIKIPSCHESLCLKRDPETLVCIAGEQTLCMFVACSAGVFFYRAISPIFHCHKIKDMAATTISRTRTRFRPPNWKYACTAGYMFGETRVAHPFPSLSSRFFHPYPKKTACSQAIARKDQPRP